MTTARQELDAVLSKHGVIPTPALGAVEHHAQLRNALLAWLERQRPQVTQEEIEAVLRKHCIRPHRDEYTSWHRTFDALVNDLLALLAPPPAPVWCKADCPRPWRCQDGIWSRANEPVHGMRGIAFCDACGAKRPSEEA